MVNNYELLATDNWQLTTVNCLLSSTTVEDPLQISSFLTNKANFPDDQMNVNKVLTKDYVNKPSWKVRKNKANSKPNKANLLNAQMNVNKVLTKDYENKSNCSLAENKPNTKPIQTQTKPISPLHAAKQTQYKPNQTQFQRQKMLPLMTVNGRRAERLQFTGCGGRFLLTKLAFFYSIVLLETNIYNRLRLFELNGKKPPISRKKPATEDTDDIIGISKLKTAVRFGRVIFLEIV